MHREGTHCGSHTAHPRGLRAQPRIRMASRARPYVANPIDSVLRDVAGLLAAHQGYGASTFVRRELLAPCDYCVPNTGFIVEINESQHFTSLRRLALSVDAATGLTQPPRELLVVPCRTPVREVIRERCYAGKLPDIKSGSLSDCAQKCCASFVLPKPRHLASLTAVSLFSRPMPPLP